MFSSQSEEDYTSSQPNQQIEIPNEDLCFNTPVEFTKPDPGYHYINMINEDQEYDSGYDAESVADNESLHSEDWKVHPQSSKQKSTGSTYATSRSVNQEDCFSSTKGKGHRPESSKPAQPATKVYSRVKPKGKLPEYLDFQGVRHYWKPVEVKTNVHSSK